MVLHGVICASAYSDRIIAMRGGAVVQDGPPEQVITEAALEDVYDMTFRVHAVGGDRIAAYFR